MGFVVGVRYLCGRAVATHVMDRERAEWPPHPDRLFMALAAAYFEAGGNSGEREALEWLEAQPPPVVIATECQFQDSPNVYVPVNDIAVPRLRRGAPVRPSQVEDAMKLLPEHRPRQPRTFPAAVPVRDTVYFIWEKQPEQRERNALANLCRRVTYLGHSSSPVQAWVGDSLPYGVTEEQGWLHLCPQENGTGRWRLRVPFSGRLAQLAESYELEQRPPLAPAVAYDKKQQPRVDPDVPHSHFSPDFVVLRQVGGRRFGLESTLLLTHHLRNTIMVECGVQPIPEWLSGHKSDGTPSERTGGHMALVPLAHVGREHADGHILGLSIVLPRDIERQEVARCLNSVLFDPTGWPKPIRLVMGSIGQCELELDEGAESRYALRPRTWTRPSTVWATVTPYCLDRHPRFSGPEYWSQVEGMIADACERIGLPRPARVVATPAPVVAGARHGREMPRLQRKGNGGTIRHVHAVLVFDRPVQGPIIIGAGRYRGYGFCRPLS